MSDRFRFQCTMPVFATTSTGGIFTELRTRSIPASILGTLPRGGVLTTHLHAIIDSCATWTVRRPRVRVTTTGTSTSMNSGSTVGAWHAYLWRWSASCQSSPSVARMATIMNETPCRCPNTSDCRLDTVWHPFGVQGDATQLSMANWLLVGSMVVACTATTYTVEDLELQPLIDEILWRKARMLHSVQATTCWSLMPLLRENSMSCPKMQKSAISLRCRLMRS